MKRHHAAPSGLVTGVACVLTVAMGDVGAAAESPYTSLEMRQIKALSQEQIEGYKTGQGMGLALAAELNGFPGPKHVLELKGELDLSADQLQNTERVFEEMRAPAERLGRQIVEQERELDRLFASHSIDANILDEQVLKDKLLK